MILSHRTVHITSLLKTFQWLVINLRIRSQILNKSYRIWPGLFLQSLLELPPFLAVPAPDIQPSLGSWCQPTRSCLRALTQSVALLSLLTLIHFSLLCWRITSSWKLSETSLLGLPVIGPYCPNTSWLYSVHLDIISWNLCLGCQSSLHVSSMAFKAGSVLCLCLQCLA